MLFNRFHGWNTPRPRTTTFSPRRNTRSRRPMVEGLEDRQLLTAWVLIGNAGTIEGTGSNHEVDVPVSLAAPSTTPVTVQYHTIDKTATAGSDYVATSGTITFQPGETSKKVPVTIIGDSIVEPTEAFVVVLSNPSSNAVLLNTQGPVSIVDDDTAVAASVGVNDVSTYRGLSGSTTMAFTVSLNAPATSTVSVTASTSNVTAIAGTDYQATSQVLTFAPGEVSKTFNVTVYGTSTLAADKLFYVNLGNTTATLARATGSGIVKYGDGSTTSTPSTPSSPTPPADLSLAINDVAMKRGLSGTKTMSFTVSLNAAATSDVTVTATTSNLIAIAGIDYKAVSQVLTFAPGETTKTIDVTIYGTSVPTMTKLFYVKLTNGSVAIGRPTGAGILNYGA